MSVRDDIEKKLSLKFTPSHLEVLDDSEKHRGHAGSRPGGETHFRVRISSPHLDSLTRVAQHRAVMETLDTELRSGVHALAIEVVKSGAAAG
jgi:BolA protein